MSDAKKALIHSIKNDNLAEWGLLNSRLMTLEFLEDIIADSEPSELLECVSDMGGCLQSVMYEKFTSKGDTFLQKALSAKPDFFKRILKKSIKSVRGKYNKRINKIKPMVNQR